MGIDELDRRLRLSPRVSGCLPPHVVLGGGWSVNNGSQVGAPVRTHSNWVWVCTVVSHKDFGHE